MRSPREYDPRSVETDTGRAAGEAPVGPWPAAPWPAAAMFRLPADAVPNTHSGAEPAPGPPAMRDHERRSSERSLSRGVSSTSRPPSSCRRTDVMTSANQAVL